CRSNSRTASFQNGMSSSVNGSDDSGTAAATLTVSGRSVLGPLLSRTTRSQRTLVLLRLFPSLSVYSSVCSRPSTYTCLPLRRYSVSDSACLPHRSMLCHSVRSCGLPALSVHFSVVARLNFATAEPPGV